MSTTSQERRLKQLCEITSSKRIFAADYEAVGVPFYRGKEIIEKQRGNLSVSTELFISEQKFTDIERKFGAPKAGDLLLTSVGTLGIPYVVSRSERFYFKDGNLTWFRNFSDLDSRFLYYWLLSPNGREELKKCTIGSSQQAMTIILLKEMVVNLPPIQLQRKIAAILSAYDDLIENNIRRIQILEEMAQALYREWFVHFRFPGHEQSNMVESEMVGLIPEGWSIVPFNKVCINYDRRRKPLSSIQRADIKGPYPYYGAAKIFDYINDFIFDGDYLLIAEDGSVITPDRKPMLQMAHGKFWVNNHTHIIQGKPPISTEFLFLALSQVDISGYITGAAQPKITQESLNRIPIVLAPIAILYMFNDTVRPLFQQMFCLQRKQENLRQTRDLLLPKLISGEVDVADLDIPLKEATL